MEYKQIFKFSMVFVIAIAIGPYLKRKLYESYDEFFKDTMKICGFPQKFASSPVHVNYFIIFDHNL